MRLNLKMELSSFWIDNFDGFSGWDFEDGLSVSSVKTVPGSILQVKEVR